jgi:hypothetical protein
LRTHILELLHQAPLGCRLSSLPHVVSVNL